MNEKLNRNIFAMKTKTIVLIILLGFFLSCKTDADYKNIDLIADFLKDVKNPAISIDSVINKHLCVYRPKENRKASREALIMLLTPLRKRLENSPDDFRNSIKRYDSIFNIDRNLNMDSGTENNGYYYTNEKGAKTFILIRDGKIASFTILRKGQGGRGVFLVFCG